ncbi:hypothetical protein [Bradyrhizobium sp. LTSP849]|uniref:hypothetical protein n=1 Tax=Bradyrhizobium sp. LTSP849 TaxID=1615890 RepID=UPI000679C617|nr:hypothetical protein [Bradyrhizobium sp. LTSP849]
MPRLRNHGHELFAQALADGKSRADAMVAAGYNWHRGNQNRLAQSPDVIARVEELRRASNHIVDLRKLDRGRILVELARIACADPPLRAAIATNGPNALPADQPVLLVDIRLEGALAKHIEMRLLDDRGALTALLRYDGEPNSPSNLDLSQSVPADFAALERVLRAVLRSRERPVE